MDQRRAMLEAVDGGDLTVTEACALWGVSRQTFYVWRRRRNAEGDAGLEDRSSAPRRSPGRIAALLEGQIVDLRKAHPRWGARRIRVELRRRGVAVPARSTVHRVLVRNGLARAAAVKAPAPLIRFVRSKANELWQMDAKEVELRDGTGVQVISALDDCCRYCGDVAAFPALSAEAACAVFDAAASELGLPESVLCDNGAIFTGRVKHCVNRFERHVWAHGVYTLNGRARHPQTQGKVERYHRTLNEWLTEHGPFDTIDALNESLRRFRHYYNHERPHQGDGMNDQTPAEAFAAAAKAATNPTLAAERCRRETVRRTTPTGNVGYGAAGPGSHRRGFQGKAELALRCPFDEVVDVVAGSPSGGEPQIEVTLGAGGQGEVAGGEPVEEPCGAEDLVAGVVDRRALGRVVVGAAADAAQHPPGGEGGDDFAVVGRPRGLVGLRSSCVRSRPASEPRRGRSRRQ